MLAEDGFIQSSFRDPSGHLFRKNGELYRTVSTSYKENYDAFMSSGLYKRLVEKGLLIAHHEADAALAPAAHKVIKPRLINFFSYPYEWCFSQLKDAALLTLEMQELCLKEGFTLKDASAFNVTFDRCKPVFVDSLSFEVSKAGGPWYAYGQFCRHFLGPLALMSYRDERLINMLKIHLDGIPLEIVSSMLPGSTFLNLGMLLHIHLHARSVKRHASSRQKISTATLSTQSQLNLVEHLRKTIRGLNLPSASDPANWKDYYQNNSYSSDGIESKVSICKTFLDRCKPASVWDVGCNTGLVSVMAADTNASTVSMDSDYRSIEELYSTCKAKDLEIYPIVVDVTNPSPACGWAGLERDSLNARGPAEMIFGLALIHHLAIGGGVPFTNMAEWFRTVCARYLVIEFVSKDDVQVKKLLLNRIDIFGDYNVDNFEHVFGIHFKILEKHSVPGAERFVYLMEVKDPHDSEL